VTGGTGASSTLTLQSTSGSGTSDAIIFNTASQLEKMRLTTAGALGIGTALPATESTNAKLTVVGAVSQSASSLATSNTNAGFTVRTNAGSGYQLAIGSTSVDGSPYIQGVNFNGGAVASNLILQGYGGNVGIGTPSPSTKLHVSGGRSTFFANSETYAIGVGYSGTTIAGYIGGSANNSNADIVFSNAGGSERMRIQGGGNVGIGTTSPAYQLQLSTDSAAKPTTNTWTIASDARLKTVLGDYEKGLDAICALRPVRYKYNGFGGMVADGKEHISIVAQEAQEVFPECIGTFQGKLHGDDEQETELLNYNGHAITFALINAIKELKAKIDIFEARN
jgi:hypothetical protein